MQTTTPDHDLRPATPAAPGRLGRLWVATSTLLWQPAPDDEPPPPAPEASRLARFAGRFTKRGMILLAVLVGLRLVAAIAVLATHPDDYQSILGGDARRYDEIVYTPGTPYADHMVEYPPVIVGFVHLIHGDTLFHTQVALVFSQLAIDLAIAGLLAWAWSRRTGLAYLVLGLPFLTFPFIYTRIDLIPALLVTLGFALLRKGWQATGGAALAIAVFAKLYPLALGPALLVERKWRAFAVWVVTGLAAAAAWVAWVGGTEGIEQVVSFRGAKGWQVESLPGILVHMADTSAVHIESGAWRSGVMPGYARPLLTALSIATAVAAWWWAYRRRGEGRTDDVTYALAPLTCVLGLLVFAPILSPQYLLWLLPFSAILAARGEKTLTWLMLAASALTTYGFMVIHSQIGGRLFATVPIVARNGLLVVMLVVAALQLSGRRRSVATEADDEADQTAGEPATATLGA
ncbi:MAG: DUF2029 domain-containing protein [Acidimicrobiales bacterium]|jgi:hypothetical protein|nr:DUF2029 domain-containing protein [Acidimicrobiales bacterium]